MKSEPSNVKEPSEGPRSEGHSSPKHESEAGPVVDYVIRTSELDELEHLTNTLISPNRMHPLTRQGELEGLFQIHGLRDFCTFDISFGRPTASHLPGEEDDERFAFVMAPKGIGQVVMNGQEYDLSDRNGVVFSAGPPRTLKYQEDCQTSVIVMNGRKVAEYCAKLLGRDLDRNLHFDAGFDLSGAAGQSWSRLFHYASAELANPASLFRHLPAVRQQLEQTVMTGFLFAHSHTYSDALLRPQAAAAPFYVKRAEAYMEAHFAEPLSLAEIAAQSGVSARSLQNGFQSFRNMTPMAFLRSLRLSRAYRALLQADPRSTSVTEIALSCGFSHMGEFSTAYRRAFGVAPRETLLQKVRAS